MWIHMWDDMGLTGFGQIAQKAAAVGCTVAAVRTTRRMKRNKKRERVRTGDPRPSGAGVLGAGHSQAISGT